MKNGFYSGILLILVLKYTIHWWIVESPSRYMSFPGRQSFISTRARLQEMGFHVFFQTWPLEVVDGIPGLHFSFIGSVSSDKESARWVLLKHQLIHQYSLRAF
jgi:hypothetical protein